MAIPCSRSDLPYALDPLQSFFDGDADGSFDLSRRGPVVDNADLNGIQRDFRVDFLAQVAQSEQSTKDDQQQQQVRCHAVLGKPSDQAIHAASPRKESWGHSLRRRFGLVS